MDELKFEKEKVLNEYYKLLHDCMSLVSKIGSMMQKDITTLSQEEFLNYKKNYLDNKELDKFFRLAAALNYVEEPTKENIGLLLENMNVSAGDIVLGKNK